VVIAGFFFSALGALFGFLEFAVDGDLRLSASADVSSFAVLFSSFTTLVAWWFLTKLADRPEQTPLLQRAYLTFALAALFSAVPYFIVNVSFFHLPTWTGAIFWSYAIGAVLTAVGFFSLSMSLRTALEDREATLLKGPIEFDAKEP
jgi:hypothetical protein